MSYPNPSWARLSGLLGGNSTPQPINMGGLPAFTPAQNTEWNTALAGLPTTGTPRQGGVTAPGGTDSGFGLNLGTFQFGVDAFGRLGNIWSGMQAQKLAKRQLDMIRSISDTNIGNQIQSYNTALGDRARSRAVAENRPQGEAEAYYQQNRLVR